MPWQLVVTYIVFCGGALAMLVRFLLTGKTGE